MDDSAFFIRKLEILPVPESNFSGAAFCYFPKMIIFLIEILAVTLLLTQYLFFEKFILNNKNLTLNFYTYHQQLTNILFMQTNIR